VNGSEKSAYIVLSSMVKSLYSISWKIMYNWLSTQFCNCPKDNWHCKNNMQLWDAERILPHSIIFLNINHLCSRFLYSYTITCLAWVYKYSHKGFDIKIVTHLLIWVTNVNYTYSISISILKQLLKTERNLDVARSIKKPSRDLQN
jgi:hypothetical protein